jgi:hypothetical protein
MTDEGPRCYTLREVLVKLKLPARTFFSLRARKRLPFLQEIRPRLGRSPRYRADLIDRYLRGEWATGVTALTEARRHGIAR